jgi:hypothetical protein
MLCLRFQRVLKSVLVCVVVLLLLSSCKEVSPSAQPLSPTPSPEMEIPSFFPFLSVEENQPQAGEPGSTPTLELVIFYSPV